MQVKILNVDVEFVKKGRNGYNKATVAYQLNGQAKTMSIVDFANPGVFKKVQELVGKMAEVTVTKNANNYDQWADIAESDGTAAPVADTKAAPTRVTGSNYETKEERAKRQVYIVRQSSISSAIELLKLRNEAGEKIQHTHETVIALAQEFENYVFTDNTNKSGFEDMNDDVPF